VILVSFITHLAEYERNYFDEWSWHLIMLRLFLFRALLITQFDGLKGQSGRAQKKILVLLITSLVLRFSVNRILQFYLFFEISAVIIFCFVLSLGYQPERLVASMYLLLFTVGSSLPFLLLLILCDNFLNVDTFQVFIREVQNTKQTPIKNFLTLLLSLGFLVKFPMYLFHV